VAASRPASHWVPPPSTTPILPTNRPCRREPDGKLGHHTTGTAEVARAIPTCRARAPGSGSTSRHEGPRVQAHLWGVRTEPSSYNPTACSRQANRNTAPRRTTGSIERDRVVAESLKTSNSTTGAEQTARTESGNTVPRQRETGTGIAPQRANAESVLSAPALPGTSTPLVRPTARRRAPRPRWVHQRARQAHRARPRGERRRDLRFSPKKPSTAAAGRMRLAVPMRSMPPRASMPSMTSSTA